jgi:hypothetical protein
VVLRIDVQGAATVKRLMPEAISIFVAAESERSLAARLAARKTEDMNKLALRWVVGRASVCTVRVSQLRVSSCRLVSWMVECRQVDVLHDSQ